MDPRLTAHFYAEAEGVHRREMARIARSVSAGFSDRAGFMSFISNLELDKPIQDSYDDFWVTVKTIDDVRRRKK